MKTRADLKRELSLSIPAGTEHAFLEQATSDLQSLHTSLESLRATRADLRRQISIRTRKRHDYKGKIPRTTEASLAGAQAEVSRAGKARCHDVARVENGATLRFAPAFRKGLDGVRGFERMWVVAVARTAETRAGRCADGVFLWLVRVVAVDVAAGVVRVDGLPAEAAAEDVQVVDVKPYLPYCEAWPARGAEGG